LDFLKGGMGQPYGGFPAWRDGALKGAKIFEGRPGDDLPPMDLSALRSSLERKSPGRHFTEGDVMSAALYPAVFNDYVTFTNKYGLGATKLPTHCFLCPMEVGDSVKVELGKGKAATYKLLSVGNLDAAGKRQLIFELDGYPCMLEVDDRAAAEDLHLKEKADPANEGSVGAPMPGDVIGVKVEVGQTVEKGDGLVVLSAMKMETVVTAPVSGKVAKVNVTKGEKVRGGDLVVELEC
jgi:pyruvate carboxylase